MPLGSIIPVLVLLTGAVATLVIGIFLPRRRQSWNAALAAAVVLVAMAAAARDLEAPPGLIFDSSFMVDQAQLWTALVILGSALLVGMLALPVFRHDQREAEFYTLLLFSALGAVMLAGAHDVMEVVMAVLLTSVGSYALVAYRRADRQALEAVLKYYLFGALTNVGLIFGLVLLYGLTGTTLMSDIGYYLGTERQPALALALVLIFVGLGFKAGYVPAHFWIPDVFQGATLPVAAWLSAGAKLAALVALYRLATAVPSEIFDWPLMIAVMAVVSMTWGNLAALRQDDLRRLLAYSTVAQSGYLLMAIAAAPASDLALQGLLYYFLAYMLANVGAFAVLAATGGVERRANAGLVRHRPALAVSMVVVLLSLTGIPPLAGFVGKFTVFTAAFQAGYAWLAAVALANSALSLFYYLRAVAPMFLDPPPQQRPQVDGWATAVAWFCAAASLAVGLGAALFF